MLKDRIISAVILLLIFLASYLSKNPTYFLSLVFVVSLILFHELAKILKLKSLSLAIYWILSFTPVIFFYLLVALNKGFVGEFLVNFSIFMSFVSVIFWFTLAPIDIFYKKISSNAKLKIFLIASPEVRAKRRYLELQNRGQEVNMLALIDDIKQRDLKDQTRVLSPLIPAEDSVVIDSSEMSLDEVLSFTKKLTKKEFNK